MLYSFKQFQYLQLVRYGILISKQLKDSKVQLAIESQQVKTISQSTRHLEETNKGLQAKITELLVHTRENKVLEQRIRELEKVEQKYKAYKEREPEIKHYLNAFAAMSK